MSDVIYDHETGEVVGEHSVANLVPAATHDTLVRPVASLADTEAAFLGYQALCDRLITKDDVQTIGGKEFRKKSGWRKLTVAFGVSCELKERNYERLPNGRIMRAEVVVRATAPNGRFMDGLGACDLFEKCCPTPCPRAQWSKHKCCAPDCGGTIHFSNPQHDIPATAHTRATNRACADLFGMGEVSAEEVTDPARGGPTNEAPPGDDDNVPLISQEDRDELLSAMNAVTTDNDERAKLKQSFARRFGSPANLTQPNLNKAWKFLDAKAKQRAAQGIEDAAPAAAPEAPAATADGDPDPGRPFDDGEAPRAEAPAAQQDRLEGPESADSPEDGRATPEGAEEAHSAAQPQ